jgi:hypothetical protein
LAENAVTNDEKKKKLKKDGERSGLEKKKRC